MVNVKALNDLYSSPYKGIIDSDTKFVPTGIKSLDYMTNDLPTKKITCVTGVPKEGKSTFLHRIALNAVDKGYKVLLIDGEHDQNDLINKLYTMAIGSSPNAFDMKTYNKAQVIVPRKDTIKLLREWHKDRLMIFTKYLAPMKSLDQLFEFTKSIVNTFDIDLVIFDNLMTLIDGPSVEKIENQSRFMKRTCDLSKFNNCHCIVVAHPNKGAIQGEPMGIYDVLGSSDIVNLTDYLIQVMRSYSPRDEADAYIRVLLNRPYGKNIGDIPLKYDRQSQSLFEMDTDGTANIYELNWQGNRGEQLCL